MSAPLALSTLAARLWLALAWLGPPADGAAGEGSGTEINWLLDAPWAKVALLVTLAVVVMFFANKNMRGRRGRRGLSQPDFDLRIAKLERLPLAPIAETKTGDVHVSGIVAKGEGALGTGPRACVYQNRAKSSRATAIAADLILVEDETGMIGVEQLADARVIAPKEETGAHDTIGLYIGDRVEILGELMVFDTPQTLDGRTLHGMLGSLGQIQIRVVERPDSPESSPDSPPDSGPAAGPPSSTSEAP